MSNYLNKICILTAALLLTFLNIAEGQETPYNREDSAAVRQTALDYIEGYFSGDAARMENAVHPDLNKATPRDLPQTGRTLLSYTTYSALLEYTRGKTGLLEDTARHIEVSILSLEHEVANVKVVSAKFTDYLQEVKIDGKWKIVNVMFTSGSGVPPRIHDFKADVEKALVEKAVMSYLDGLSAGDASRVEQAIDPEFSRISVNGAAGESQSSFRRQRYAAVVESTLAGIGKQDEIYRDNSADVLDVCDGLAVVRCEMPRTVEFVQMYKNGGQWKILNSVSVPNPSLTFSRAMTVIAGDPMPDFTLPVYQGGSFRLADHLGKNVLLIFPRGWVGNGWCAYCPYQYLELEKLAMEKNIKAKYDLEIAFVMPYSRDRIRDWMDKFPEALAQVERIKKPSPSPPEGSLFYDYSNWVAEKFPITFSPEPGDPHDMIPVLVDEDRTLSRQLKIFTNFWDGATSEQNMASVFIIDKEGTLRFKYIGQMTEDRPDVNFLLNYIKELD